MKLDIIIPVYNREAMIGSALRSLLRQADAADLEIVVVDDGSTDGTVPVVEAMAEAAPIIRLVRQPHGGVTRARNTGLAHVRADTEFVTFLDSDDISPAGRLAAELQRFREDPALDLTYGPIMLVDAVDDEALGPAPSCRSVTVRGLSLCAGIFRRTVFDRLGGFDESLKQAEDADFLFRLFEQRPHVFFSEIVAAIYRRHPGNITKDTETGRHSLARALLKSIQRRRADPQLVSLDGIFDLDALAGVRWL